MRPLLCELHRGGLIESVHEVAVSVAEGAREIYARGAVDVPAFLRSCAKPFQAMTVVEVGAAGAFGFVPREMAVISGSHHGERRAVGLVEAVLRKARLRPAHLRCGVHPPYSTQAQQELARARRRPTVLHNNCSGKHAGMLAAARRMGAGLETYLEASHPVQRANLRQVARLAAVAPGRVQIGVDGCGVPTFGLSVRAMALAMATFCVEEGPARVVREAMMAHPSLVGRPCRALMEAAPGRLVAKAGAEGVYVCGLAGRAVGIALKVRDGALRPAAHVLGAVLDRLGLLGAGDRARLLKVAEPEIRNHAGRAVGRVKIRF